MSSLNWVEVVFWFCAGLAVYAYAGYPLLIGILARLRGRPVRRAPYAGSFSVIIAAHNESSTIGRRVEEFRSLIERSGARGETIIVSDGSSDETAALARAAGATRVIEFRENRGKAAGLNAATEAATGDVVVFADARQHWAPDAVSCLLENFADGRVGATTGDLVLETPAGALAGVGTYWRYEKWLRRQESLLHSTTGLTGAICAVRRTLYCPVPPGTILDDVYWPLRVAMQGYRVIHDERAKAYDRLPERTRDEFRRKVRTLAGNFQLLAILPGALVPGKNPIWFQVLSHKALRLAVPWALIAALVMNVFLGGAFYRTLLAAQAAGYLTALASLPPKGWLGRTRLGAAAASLVVLNAAAWLAFWVWLTGRSGRAWRKSHYQPARAAGEPQHGVDVPSEQATLGSRT